MLMTARNTVLTGILMMTLLALGACSSAPPRLSTENIAAILASPDRSDADRSNDARRKADRTLAFIDARPGMRVLDLGAGGGYTTELLARAVGPTGRVFAQLTPEDAKGNAGTRLADRLKTPAMRNAALRVHSYDNPVPPDVEAGSLDLVTYFFTYHDLGPNVDRARINQAVFRALKPGGRYVIADHSGRSGTGVSEFRTLHRVEEAFLRREVEAVGFRLIEEADFLRNPADPRDKIVFKPAQPNDEFVLKFVKPGGQ